MKKLLLAVLVSLGLQIQAQTPCDSTMSYTVGSQYQLEIAFGVGGNTPSTWTAPLYVWTYYEHLNVNAVILGEDSCFGQPCTHMVYNYNPNGSYYDTLTTCVTYMASDSLGNIDTLMCCFDQYWNGQAWARMMQQQPYFCCDSVSYWTDQGQGLFIGLDTTGISLTHNLDSIEVLWSICNSSQCYTGDGMSDYFPQITTTDTIKVCYDAYLYTANTMELCTHCDSLIYDQGVYNWVLFSSQGNPLSINELIFNRINDGKIYDLLGRELTEIPVGKLYIRNNKLYIKK